MNDRDDQHDYRQTEVDAVCAPRKPSGHQMKLITNEDGEAIP